MINIKAIKTLLFYGSLLSIISCRSDQQNNLTESVKGVSFSVSVDDFGNSDTKNQTNIKARSGDTNIISKQEFTSGPFNIASELSEDTSNKISTRSFLPGARKFRIVAYDSQTGDYVAQDVGSTSAPNQKLFENISLVGDRKYTFITYSLNSSTDPPIAPTTNLNQAKINLSGLNGQEAGTDLLYAINENVMISGGNTVINVTLKHQFSRILLSVDNRNATGTPGQPNYVKGSYPLDNNGTGGFTGIIEDYYTSGNMNLKDASITEGVNQRLPVSGITTTTKALIINTGSEDIYKSKLIIPPGAIVIGNDVNANPVSIAINGTNGEGLLPGASYTLKLKFNSDRYVDEAGTTKPKESAGYAVIGGYRWGRFNVGIADTNPMTNDPDNVLVWKIRGNFYQWGKNTVASYPATNWDSTGNTNDQAWNSGTEDHPIKASNDPCEEGFRVPTRSEFMTLLKNSFPTGNSLATSTLLISRKSTDVKLTFPGSGYLNSYNGFPYNDNSARYWLSSSSGSGISLTSVIIPNVTLPSYGFNIRCIAE
ncbi:hypothetical protein [Elizabethkingia anophelis]|uniref:hypothetical protein n=1 Tax=Elizabethkingia anophelis TaxID=1117645 RepID=UPI0016293607|nr:hypothetical protein [Elizabethkingia anophelis]MCT4323496.1 hypothetical protein [Elizabethkingia anophelis]HAY3535899.1 hypothetical protein [Elizabethkingia anophelis]HAY3548116.1 hypothetical protein [Elizabethkingia anophelis]HAY3592925.1 hypothetical protein [Elizabethkingia anophelis]